MFHNSVPRFRAQYAADAMCVGVIRGEVRAVARELGIEGEELGHVALAVSEAATNAVVHGSVGRDDPRIGLRVEVGDLEMFVTIVDDGDGLKPRHRGLGETRMGAGLAIIAALTGRLDVRTGSEGTEIRLTFPRAVQPLEDALAEQDRLGISFDGAVGTSTPGR